MDAHLADSLRYLAEGVAYLAPVDADAKHFFLPPEVHVVQGLGFGLLCIFTLYGTSPPTQTQTTKLFL
jgi:hypothetical protein